MRLCRRSEPEGLHNPLLSDGGGAHEVLQPISPSLRQVAKRYFSFTVFGVYYKGVDNFENCPFIYEHIMYKTKRSLPSSVFFYSSIGMQFHKLVKMQEID